MNFSASELYRSSSYIYVYINIYIYNDTNIYIYIYIYIQALSIISNYRLSRDYFLFVLFVFVQFESEIYFLIKVCYELECLG